jgi:hypothetical protein
MENKIYTSFAQIENDLEILKIEREIHYTKIKLYGIKTKESLSPLNLIEEVINVIKTRLTGSYGTILSLAIPFVINWIIKRKRG